MQGSRSDSPHDAFTIGNCSHVVLSSGLLHLYISNNGIVVVVAVVVVVVVVMKLCVCVHGCPTRDSMLLT